MIFAKKEELSEWLKSTLYTGNDKLLYRDNQVQLNDTCIPILGQKNRLQLQELLLELLAPFLLFLRVEKIVTYEPSLPARREYMRYHADGLYEDFLEEEESPIVTLVDLSDAYVILHRIYIQELHRQELDLTQLWKFLVMHFLVEQREPITYLVASDGFLLKDIRREYQVEVTCKDTCVYERLLWEYTQMMSSGGRVYLSYSEKEGENER